LAEASDPAARLGARRALAAALRELIERVPRAPAEPAELEELAETLRGVVARWDARPAQTPAESEMLPGMGDFLERGPLVGLSNPIAPPLRYGFDEASGEAHGEVRFGDAYEGGPGVVHGGFLSAVLDEVLGFTTIRSGRPGFTGELTVRYLGPTPTCEPLSIRARYDHHEGRRIYASGEIRAGERVSCRAEGLFIAVDAERFAEMKRQRETSRAAAGEPSD